MIRTATQYSLGDQMEKNVMGGHVAHMGERRDVYFIFCGGVPKGNRLFGRNCFRWNNNIKMYLQEVGLWGYGLVGTGSG